MDEAFFSMIKNEVRSYLHSVENLSHLRYKPVIEMLENKLQIRREIIESQKKLIKSIIKDEMCQEMLTRTSPDSVLPTHVGSQIPIPNTFYPETHTVSNVNILDVPLTNAYTIFYNEKRLLLSQENSTLSDEEIDKKIEQLWNELTPNQRKSYVNTMSIPRFPAVDWSRDELTRHREREIKARSRELSLSYHQPHKLPKKARSAYIFYCLKHRPRIQEANTNISPMEVSRRLGQEWNSLTSEQKEPYKQEEAEDKKRYLKELHALGLTTEDLKRSSRNSSLSASRARSAYMYFCSEKRDEIRAQNPQWNTSEVNRALINMWNRMSEEEKRHFEMSAFDDKDRIRRELEKVKQTIKTPMVIPSHKVKRTRRARTPYTIFYKEHMAQLRQENTAIGFGEVSKILSDTWKSMTDDQKQEYVNRSRMESETMHPMGLIEPEPGKEDMTTERAAYSNFASVIRRDNPNFSESDLREMIDQKWASMSQSERVKYLSPVGEHPADAEPKNEVALIDEHQFSTDN